MQTMLVQKCKDKKIYKGIWSFNIVQQTIPTSTNKR